jgi:hypothetical protein
MCDASIVESQTNRGRSVNEGVGQPEGSAGEENPLERVRASFEKQGLIHMLGAKVVEAGEGFCTIEVPFSDGATQQERYFHGAVIWAGTTPVGTRRLRSPRRIGRC